MTNAYRASGGCIISVSEFVSYPTVHFRSVPSLNQAWHCWCTPPVACVQHVDDFCLSAGGYKQKRALHATLDTSWKKSERYYADWRLGLASLCGVAFEWRNYFEWTSVCAFDRLKLLCGCVTGKWWRRWLYHHQGGIISLVTCFWYPYAGGSNILGWHFSRQYFPR